MFLPEQTTFNDFRDNLACHMRDLKRSKRPTFIIRNGKRTAVLMSPETYERLAADADRHEAIAAIRRGLADVRRGKTKPADEVLDRLENKYKAMAGKKHQ